MFNEQDNFIKRTLDVMLTRDAEIRRLSADTLPEDLIDRIKYIDALEEAIGYMRDILSYKQEELLDELYEKSKGGD